MAFGFVGKAVSWFGDKVAAEVERRVHDKLEMTGQKVVARAKQLVPVDTGALQKSISYEVERKELTITVGESYGLFVEAGTRNMRPQPYIRPALLEAGKVWGSTVAMRFTVPTYANPLIAHRDTILTPMHGLSAKQRRHIQTHLIPTARRLYRGNVARARLNVRRIP